MILHDLPAASWVWSKLRIEGFRLVAASDAGETRAELALLARCQSNILQIVSLGAALLEVAKRPGRGPQEQTYAASNASSKSLAC